MKSFVLRVEGDSHKSSRAHSFCPPVFPYVHHPRFLSSPCKKTPWSLGGCGQQSNKCLYYRCALAYCGRNYLVSNVTVLMFFLPKCTVAHKCKTQTQKPQHQRQFKNTHAKATTQTPIQKHTQKSHHRRQFKNTNANSKTQTTFQKHKRHFRNKRKSLNVNNCYMGQKGNAHYNRQKIKTRASCVIRAWLQSFSSWSHPEGGRPD